MAGTPNQAAAHAYAGLNGVPASTHDLGFGLPHGVQYHLDSEVPTNHDLLGSLRESEQFHEDSIPKFSAEEADSEFYGMQPQHPARTPSSRPEQHYAANGHRHSGHYPSAVYSPHASTSADFHSDQQMSTLDGLPDMTAPSDALFGLGDEFQWPQGSWEHYSSTMLFEQGGSHSMHSTTVAPHTRTHWKFDSRLGNSTSGQARPIDGVPADEFFSGLQGDSQGAITKSQRWLDTQTNTEQFPTLARQQHDSRNDGGPQWVAQHTYSANAGPSSSHAPGTPSVATSDTRKRSAAGSIGSRKRVRTIRADTTLNATQETVDAAVAANSVIRSRPTMSGRTVQKLQSTSSSSPVSHGQDVQAYSHGVNVTAPVGQISSLPELAGSPDIKVDPNDQPEKQEPDTHIDIKFKVEPAEVDCLLDQAGAGSESTNGDNIPTVEAALAFIAAGGSTRHKLHVDNDDHARLKDPGVKRKLIQMLLDAFSHDFLPADEEYSGEYQNELNKSHANKFNAVMQELTREDGETYVLCRVLLLIEAAERLHTEGIPSRFLDLEKYTGKEIKSDDLGRRQLQTSFRRAVDTTSSCLVRLITIAEIVKHNKYVAADLLSKNHVEDFYEIVLSLHAYVYQKVYNQFRSAHRGIQQRQKDFADGKQPVKKNTRNGKQNKLAVRELSETEQENTDVANGKEEVVQSITRNGRKKSVKTGRNE